MDFTFKLTVNIIAYLLLALVVTQILYTAIYISGIDLPRKLLWGLEAILFTFLAAFAGAAMVQAKNYHVGWSAIVFSAALNVVQVGVGLTLFGPFREAAGQVEALTPVAGAIVAFSFMIYNAAKVLLGFAAVIFGVAKMNTGAKALGGLTVAVGVVTMIANTITMAFGRDTILPSAHAGGSGVLATALLAVCLISFARED